MQKGSSRFAVEAGQTQILILAGIVILLAVAGGIFFLGRVSAPKPQNVATPAPQPSPSSTEAPAKAEDPTANWKTYTNTKYGFSFKYPPQLSISNEFQSKEGLYVELSQPTWAMPRMTISIVIDTKGIQKYSTDLNTILSTRKLDDYTYSLISTQDIKGMSLYSFSKDWDSSPGKLPPVGGPLSTLTAIGVNKGIVYNIDYLYEDPSAKELMEGDKNIFTQILSTFKFLP